MILKNNRGASLLGTVIAAGIGLLVVLGIAKGLINFSSQTQKTVQKQQISNSARNIHVLLSNADMWRDSMNSKKPASCKYPGASKKCPMVLYKGSSRWTCSEGKKGEAIALVSTTGSVVNNVDCSKCKKSPTCGQKGKFFRVRLKFKNASPDLYAPVFEYRTEDIGLTKQVSKYQEVVNRKTLEVDLNLIQCRLPFVLIGLNPDGTPQCTDINTFFASKGECPAGTLLIGFRNNGSLKCKNVGTAMVEAQKDVPRGTVVMWSGSGIPTGWALCNGGNGTPDLRNRFVVGVGSSNGFRSRGGLNTVRLTTGQMPAHSHGSTHSGARVPVDINWGAEYKTGWSSEMGWRATSARPFGISNAGSNQAHENRPPYYALYYIMKL